ncbi:hypothetical protein [Archangium sp. Cb G35]|uniref:hypothetical protein n=1 Tax=Archangium sp. Cb G35 TaxID=1920190 RepID=UPI000ABE2836|nr:hypothetical protein [Archangium sp. Cb G35]
MNKLMPLLAFAVTACGPTLLDRELRDIPGLKLFVPYTSGSTAAIVYFDWSLGQDCYRIPADTHLTFDGESTTLVNRGNVEMGVGKVSSCAYPHFSSPSRPADEPLTEFVLSDGRSRMRAVFQSLVSPRQIRVNGQQEAILRPGAEVDLEWLPVTDRPGKMMLDVVGDEGGGWHGIQNLSVQGNHVRFTLPALRPGRYRLLLTGQVTMGVEACEGFSSCEAEFTNLVEAPIVIE